jgi:ADP-ribose pyrophosphatase YjhB (NUDIX family)
MGNEKEQVKRALAADRRWRLMEIIPCEGGEIPGGSSPLTRAVVVARRGADVLLVLNRRRHEWELPGGTVTGGEEPRDCAVREFSDETGQESWYLELSAVYRLEARRGNRVEWGALYDCKLGDLKFFVPDQKIARLEIWNTRKKLEGLNPIDRELALFLMKG